MSDTQDLAEKVKAAEAAVQGLNEPLKTEAFKIVLSKLLSSGGNGEDKDKQQPLMRAQSKSKKSRKAASRSSAQSGSGFSTTTNLNLGVDDLRKLKIYCERFDLGGSEQIAFVLANFIREHTQLEFTLPADIIYLYRQLVSQRVKVAAINDAADWVRALNWLTVPSRKKEWLEKDKSGYTVSNSGLLRFHELEAVIDQKAG